jgi:thiamine-monophosphate kinase
VTTGRIQSKDAPLKSKPLDEFERIARFFAPLAGPGALDLKDDVALLDGPAGTQYVLTTDAIVAGIHFFPDDPPRQIAQKLLRVNLSDLAAKGAEPVGYLLTTALTAAEDERWLAGFAAGLAADQKRFGIALLGGDSVRTKGAATLSVAAIGRVAAGAALLRGGARAGDTLYMSGTLGDAALGLAFLKQKHVAPAKAGAQGKRTSPTLGPRLRGDDERFLIDRYRLPEPRLELGRALVGVASAAMDISDGLVADLSNLCAASQVAAIVDAALLPLSAAARAALKIDPALLEDILTGGDDYEILFTAQAAARRALAKLPVTAIGRIEAGEGVTVRDAGGLPMSLKREGYRHFK